MSIYWTPGDDEPPHVTPEAMPSPVDGKRERGFSANFRVTHVPFGALIDYVRGRGSEATRGSVWYLSESPDEVVGAPIALFNRRRTASSGPPASRDWSSTARHRGGGIFL